MKPEIHPEYGTATVHCACGNSFETRSTQDDIHVEICSVCHPFFTGRQKLVDTAGRVERFQRRREKSEQIRKERAAVEESRAEAGDEVDETSEDRAPRDLEALAAETAAEDEETAAAPEEGGEGEEPREDAGPEARADDGGETEASADEAGEPEASAEDASGSDEDPDEE